MPSLFYCRTPISSFLQRDGTDGPDFWKEREVRRTSKIAERATNKLANEVAEVAERNSWYSVRNKRERRVLQAWDVEEQLKSEARIQDLSTLAFEASRNEMIARNTLGIAQQQTRGTLTFLVSHAPVSAGAYVPGVPRAISVSHSVTSGDSVSDFGSDSGSKGVKRYVRSK